MELTYLETEKEVYVKENIFCYYYFVFFGGGGTPVHTI
jgi:hypothetical protein